MNTHLSPSAPPPKHPTHLPGVGSVGLSHDPNPSHRRSDEDATSIIPYLSPPTHTISPSPPSPASSPSLSRSTSATSSLSLSLDLDASAFLAVYDGHGGSAAALHASTHLHTFFATALASALTSSTPHPIAAALASAYASEDAALRALRMFRTGATAVTCYIHTSRTGLKTLTTANVGDSRAVLCRAGGALRLSRDHLAAEARERARVEAAGGFVCARRINGVLEVSRALGDHCFKSCVVSTPSIDERVLGDADHFLILACDGLWDVVGDDMAVAIACDAFDEGRTAAEVADVLVKRAIAEGSTDNVTVVCTRFGDW